MRYNDKLLAVTRFIEDNFDDPVELTIALGLSVEDFIRLLPDVLVSNYTKFYPTHDYTEEDAVEEDKIDFGTGEDWEDPET
jgi:hypothetical protein